MKFFIKNSGLISASGKDVSDLLNRLSTNNISMLSKGEFVKTILLNEKARIVDMTNVFNNGEDFFLETSSGKEDDIITYFDRFTFAEDVKFEKKENFRSLIIFFDGDGEDKIKALFKAGAFSETTFSIKDEFIFYIDDFKKRTVNILFHQEKTDQIKNILRDSEELSCIEYERIRIESGIPEAELNDKINPLECGLKDFISFSKGCYIGQEVIARLDAQEKIPKEMIKIVSQSKIEPGDEILNEEGKEVGFISSAVTVNGISLGLGFIRKSSLDVGKKYSVKKNNDIEQIKISKII